MDLIFLAKKTLKEQGFGGLYHDDCGCELDDLMPCCAPCIDCTAGYKSTHSVTGEWVISGKKDLPDDRIEVNHG